MWRPTKASESLLAPTGFAPWRELDDDEYLACEHAYIDAYLGTLPEDADDDARHEHESGVRRVRAAFRKVGYFEHDGDKAADNEAAAAEEHE